MAPCCADDTWNQGTLKKIDYHICFYSGQIRIGAGFEARSERCYGCLMKPSEWNACEEAMEKHALALNYLSNVHIFMRIALTTMPDEMITWHQ